MANLDITHGAHRIRIDLFDERIRVYKEIQLSNLAPGPAQVNWSTGSPKTPTEARDFARWLTVAAELADDLDRLIKTEADFGRVVVEAWPPGASGEARGAVKVFENENRIIIYYPAAWVEEAK